jgi:hypothetical protein
MSGFDLGRLEDLIVCPECHAKLVVVDQGLVCTGRECRLSFPVREGIPVLLVDEAETLDEPDWQTTVGDSLDVEEDADVEEVEVEVEPENES